MRANLITSLAVIVLLGSLYSYAKADSTAVPAAKSTNVVNTVSASGFSDTKGHWAETAITGGIPKGYVDGYPDGTFKPDGKVTRAEFIKMVDSALRIPVSGTTTGDDWYLPYVNGAVNAGIHQKWTDFTSGDWNTAMTRKEMARVAVRAATGDKNIDDQKWMYLATKAGLITGMDDTGTLGEDQTTTRAQSVTIIERILSIKKGVTLPVDEKAFANAEQSMNAPKDPWGRAIRTTDLPSNSGDFPYILQDIPNEMYELKHKLRNGTILNPKAIVKDSRHYSKEAVDGWVKLISQFGTQLLNVDYNTIDQNWMDTYVQNFNQPKNIIRDTQKYMDWVKENHIRIEGSITPEPSIVYLGDGQHFIRCKFRFKVTSFDENKNLFNDIWTPQDKLQKDVWYIGYTDISIAAEGFGVRLTEEKVSSGGSIFRFASYSNE